MDTIARMGGFMFGIYFILLACIKPVEKQVVPVQEVIEKANTDVPQKTQGVTSVEKLGFIDLRKEFSNIEEPLFFRLRRLEIGPQGTVGFHEHKNRPGVAYILEGAITEYRDSEQLVRKTGEYSFEYNGVQHGWKNHTQEPVRAIVVDVWSPGEEESPEIGVLPEQKEFGEESPKTNSGIALAKKEMSSLDDIFEGKTLRIRVVSVESGGVVGAHKHESRPSFAYVLSGDVIEHRGDGDYPHESGSSVAERNGLMHWWKNTGEEAASIVVVDIVDVPKK